MITVNDTITNQISPFFIQTDFEKLYIASRKKENRLYTDEQLRQLPLVAPSQVHQQEWIIRKNSCRALINFIRQKNNIVNILEVGCGNGWLSAQLAKAVDTNITGIDINTTELNQARRVFYKLPSLTFIDGSLDANALQNKKFDLVIFAASIQYFPSLTNIITQATEHLSSHGEILIMDSPFYQPGEIEAAKQRSRQHYNAIGFPEMADHYYHHTLNEVKHFRYKIIHHPASWKNKLSIKKNPFYWLSIKKPQSN